MVFCVIPGVMSMIIDKTTGKGCAQSIASKEVVKKLVAEGILGKPILGKFIKQVVIYYG